MKRILIISGGDFAAKVIRLINRIGGYVVIGYTDIVDRGSLFGVKHLGTDREIPDLIKKHPGLKAVLQKPESFTWCFPGFYQVESCETGAAKSTFSQLFPRFSPGVYLDASLPPGPYFLVFTRFLAGKHQSSRLSPGNLVFTRGKLVCWYPGIYLVKTWVSPGKPWGKAYLSYGNPYP